MESVKRVSYLITTVAIAGLLGGCFTYHRTVTETPTPAVVTVPPGSSATTTTTTTNDNGQVEQQRSTTTYSSNP